MSKVKARRMKYSDIHIEESKNTKCGVGALKSGRVPLCQELIVLIGHI